LTSPPTLRACLSNLQSLQPFPVQTPVLEFFKSRFNCSLKCNFFSRTMRSALCPLFFESVSPPPMSRLLWVCFIVAFLFLYPRCFSVVPFSLRCLLHSPSISELLLPAFPIIPWRRVTFFPGTIPWAFFKPPPFPACFRTPAPELFPASPPRESWFFVVLSSHLPLLTFPPEHVIQPFFPAVTFFFVFTTPPLRCFHCGGFPTRLKVSF